MPTAGDITRHFLGWDSPVLPNAAHWLIDRFGLDLSGVLVVVPGARAGRRLVELLVNASAEATQNTADAKGYLLPPEVVTFGGLAQRMMPSGLRVIPAERSMVLRAQVLREADEELLAGLTPNRPERDDWSAWWSLAEQFERLSDELGAVGLLPNEVPAACSALSDDPRWAAIAELDDLYHARLSKDGWADRHESRRSAAAQGLCESPGHVVLLASPGLPAIHRTMLASLSSPVTALIAAPESHAEGFDTYGVLSADYWAQRTAPVEERSLHIVDRPTDQARRVVDVVGVWHTEHGVSADEITVGLGDAGLAPAVEWALGLAALPSRLASGLPAGRARPVTLLKALSVFASGMRFSDLADLLRHPDLYDYAAKASGQPGELWLNVMDRYAIDHLQGRVTGRWLGAQADKLAAVYDPIRALLPESLSQRLPLPQWEAAIADAIAQVYADRRLNLHTPADRPLVGGLQAIGAALDVLRTMASEDEADFPKTTFTQAVQFVLNLVASRAIADPGGPASLELVGYLELALDDAPFLALVGLNEGAVPEPTRPDPLLPASVRSELGLPGDSQRLARDQLALQVMLHSRSRGRSGLVLLAGRRAAAGDPLMPSRLLLGGDDEALTRRVARFFAEDDHSPAAPLLLTPGKTDRFLVPLPTLRDTPLTKLSVTAFRDYLACPYRFYLRHIEKLTIVDDQAVELDGGAFGSLAHDALKVLAQPEWVNAKDAGAIAGALDAELDRLIAKQMGASPPAAVRVQAEQLRYRLHAFAHEQATLMREGWSIRHAEQSIEAAIDVDGEPFTIRGRIDRIDTHPELGLRVIDYKTSDQGREPDKTHRVGAKDDKTWCDLQLPLYIDLCNSLGLNGPFQLGYINLPKDVSVTGFVKAPWEAYDLDEAAMLRDSVIRDIRAQKFWPPQIDPPRFDDGYAGICADQAVGRAGILRASQAAGKGDSQ